MLGLDPKTMVLQACDTVTGRSWEHTPITSDYLSFQFGGSPLRCKGMQTAKRMIGQLEAGDIGIVPSSDLTFSHR